MPEAESPQHREPAERYQHSEQVNGAGDVTPEPYDPGENGVTSEVAFGGEGPGRNGDDTIVMTAPGHRSATEHAQSDMSDMDDSDVDESNVGQPEDPDATQVFDAIRDDEDAAAGGPGQFGTAAGGPGQFGTAAGGPGQAGAAPGAIEDAAAPDATDDAAEPEPEPEPQPQPEPEPEPDEPGIPLEDQHPQPHVRVDARLLEAALLNLRKRIAAIPLVFEIEGSAEIKAERAKLLSQIDDYLLPRVRRSAAPVEPTSATRSGAADSRTRGSR